jgi:hypothetical protein
MSDVEESRVLPPELWVSCFHFLPLSDLVSCSLVSREWHDLTQEESLWRNLSVHRYGRVFTRAQYINLCNLQRKGSARPIKLKVVSCDGGQYSGFYSVEKLFTKDGVYCSKKENNINIVLTADRESIGMLISSVVLKSPNNGFTAPVADALVFFSDELPPVENSTCYDDFTKQQWLHLQDCKQNEQAEEAKEWMKALSEYPLRPVAFLETHMRRTSIWGPGEGVHKATCPFQPALLTKYIHLKLLRPNSRSDGWSGGNIDCQYFGALGQNVTLDLLNNPSAIEQPDLSLADGDEDTDEEEEDI